MRRASLVAPGFGAITLLVALIAATARAAPGDLLFTVDLPFFGTGVAVDCDGQIYVTGKADANLYRIDLAGNVVATIPLVDATDGSPFLLGEIAWDEGRQAFWAEDNRPPPFPELFVTRVFRVTPANGKATFVFQGQGGACWSGNKSGLAYDRSTGTVWLLEAACPYLQQWSSAGTWLKTVTLRDAAGIPQYGTSGIVPHPDGFFYVGLENTRTISRYDATTGAYLGDLASALPVVGAGLDCDCVNFAPTPVIWRRRDVDPDSLSAYEADPRACSCGACPAGLPAVKANPPITLCGAGSATLDVQSSSACGPAGLEYRWFSGATVSCDWSTTSSCRVTPGTTTDYSVSVRCADQRCCGASDVLTVKLDPDLVPGDLGNTLRAARDGAAVALQWGADPLAATYSVYRGSAKDTWPTPAWTSGLTATSLVAADIAAPPDLYFYRVAAVSCSGKEGP